MYVSICKKKQKNKKWKKTYSKIDNNFSNVYLTLYFYWRNKRIKVLKNWLHIFILKKMYRIIQISNACSRIIKTEKTYFSQFQKRFSGVKMFYFVPSRNKSWLYEQMNSVDAFYIKSVSRKIRIFDLALRRGVR